MADNGVIIEMRRFRGNVTDSAHQAVLAGLGTVERVGEQSAHLFDRLVERGRKVEKKGQERFGEVFGEVRERLQAAGEDLGKVVEKRLHQFLGRFDIPTRKEVQTLTRRIEKLSTLIHHLLETVAAEGAAPTVYHVTHDGELWQVRAEGAKKAESTHGTKGEATAAARDLARAHEPSEVVVYKMDGSEQSRIRYGEMAVN